MRKKALGADRPPQGKGSGAEATRGTSAAGSPDVKWTGSFVCPDCGKGGFSTKRGLINHQSRWCPKRKEKGGVVTKATLGTKRFVCPDCGRSFVTERGRASHRARWCPKRPVKGGKEPAKMEKPAEMRPRRIKDIEEGARLTIPEYRNIYVTRVLKHPDGDMATMINGETVARFSPTDSFEKSLGMVLTIMILARKLNEIIEGRK